MKEFENISTSRHLIDMGFKVGTLLDFGCHGCCVLNPVGKRDTNQIKIKINEPLKYEFHQN